MRELIEKYFTGDLEREERIRLLKAVDSDEEIKKEFSRYQNSQALFSFSDTVINPIESRQAYRSFQSLRKRKILHHFVWKSFGYAAAIAILIISVHLYHFYTYKSYLPETTNASLFVPAGQRMNITLSDGTAVWLNARSRLTYPSVFTGNERRVKLEGEAYFEVVHNKDKPFIVEAGNIDMKVLGTCFNVESYRQEGFSRVSLIEGSLQVYDPLTESEGVILHPNEEVIVQDGQMNVTPIPNMNSFLWKEGIYSFENEEFGVILKRLELYYDMEIIVKEPSMLKWRYTVKFRQQDSIDEIMHLLQRIQPFRIQKSKTTNQLVLTEN